MIRTKPLYLCTGKTTLQVIRQGAGSWVSGRYEEAPEELIEITGNIQPLPRGIRTKLNPAGDYTTDCFMLFTNDMVRQQKEGDGGYDADTIMWEGKELVVMQAYAYSMGPLSHYEAVCVRKELV